MVFTGLWDKNRFGELYALQVRYGGEWISAPYDNGAGMVHFTIRVDENTEAFKAELCAMIDCPEENLSLWQRFVNFLTKKGDVCDQCC